MDSARTTLREGKSWDSIKKFYTKISPDIGTLLPDLRRQAPLVSRTLLVGCGVAGVSLLLAFLLTKGFARSRFSQVISARGTVVAAAISFLALFAGPGVWALSPLWQTGGMLPAADASVLVRALREREQLAEQRAREAARVAALSMTAMAWAASPGMAASGAPLVASDLALFTRGGARPGRADLARSGRGARGGPPGARGPGFAGGGRGPGMVRDDERSRRERQKLVAFLKANDNGERWLLAVSGQQQASSYIIEEGLSVMPIGGFGGTPTLGTEPEEIKERLAKLVEEGQIRFFEVGGGRGGPGGNRRPNGGFGPRGRAAGGAAPVPAAGGPVGGGPPGFGRGNAAVSQWVEEQVEKGKAKQVDRKLYTSDAPIDVPGGRRQGRGFGMMPGGNLYDLRPELGLREPYP